jgi:hypothetical protein
MIPRNDLKAVKVRCTLARTCPAKYPCDVPMRPVKRGGEAMDNWTVSVHGDASRDKEGEQTMTVDLDKMAVSHFEDAIYPYIASDNANCDKHNKALFIHLARAVAEAVTNEILIIIRREERRDCQSRVADRVLEDVQRLKADLQEERTGATRTAQLPCVKVRGTP